MYKRSCFTSPRMDEQSCFTSSRVYERSCFTSPRVGSGSALVSCSGLGPRYESASVPGKFLPRTKGIVTASFSPSVSFLSVAASRFVSDGLDGGTTAESVSIVALKQSSRGTSVTIPSFNLRGIWTGEFDLFCTNMPFVSWVTR